MVTESIPDTQPDTDSRSSRLPMIVIALAQILMVFNISSLQVSIEGIVSSFGTPATTIATAIVTYSLVVAGLIMLGARMGQMFGSRRVFRAMVLLFAAAMLLMTVSAGVGMMIVAQAMAGVAAAALVPSLVVLVAANYKGSRQEKALGWLSGAQAMGIVLAFLIAGILTTWAGWRYTYGFLVVLAAVIYRLSARLSPVKTRIRVSIDSIGVVLAASAVTLISLGANNLTTWGLLLATPEAPMRVLNVSPAPIMIVCGIFLAQGFLTWTRRRQASGRTPLIALDVLETSKERASLFSIFMIGALGSAITFLIPLYIQIVQGRTGLQTAVAVIPFSLSSFAAAVLVVRLYDALSPRRIARYAFILVAVGVALLAIVIRNEWSTFLVILSMSLAGLGEGSLVTVLFNVLVTASPKELAGDVGSLRGTMNNLAAGVGTAIAGALVVGVLSAGIHRQLDQNPVIPNELTSKLNLNSVPFINNGQLRSTLEKAAAAPEHVNEAVRINTEERLVALKVSFLALAGLALLAILPAGGLPGYVRTELSADSLASSGQSKGPATDLGEDLAA